jgi:predicted GIY-YIG superfamily endonuclease
VPGQIYLLHFERSYRHARHYLGWTENLEQRLEAHRSGRGSPLVAAAVADGIEFQLAATWSGDRHRERKFHRYKNSGARLCPICRAEQQTATSTDVAPNGHGGDATDELVMRVLADLSEPVTLTALQSHLLRGGHGPVGSLHGRLELLALRGRVCKCWLLGETAWGL